MAEIGENLSNGLKIWELPKELVRKSFEQNNAEVDNRKIDLNGKSFDHSGEKKLNKIPYVKITKFPLCWMATNSKVLKKTPEKKSISIDKPKGLTKLCSKTRKEFNAIPKRLQYPESEDEYDESTDAASGLNVCNNKDHYSSSTGVKKETGEKMEGKNCNPKPKTKSKENNNKENDVNVKKKTQLMQTATNRTVISDHTLNVGVLKKDTVQVVPKHNKLPMRRLSTCQSADRREHLLWLQPRRNVGVWIECCHKNCHKWRYVENYRDPVDVPKLWYCEMNNDKRFANCAVPEQELPEDSIMNAYNAGSIVWARLNGYPWWPAMVDDCPELLQFYETHGKSKVPQKYHVIFFNKKIETAWIPVKDIKPYTENPRNSFLKKTKFGSKDYSKQLDVACKCADEALPLTIPERLKRFSYVSRISADNKPQTRKKRRQARQRSKSASSKALRTNDEAKVSAVMPLSTSTDETLLQNWIRRQKDSVNHSKSSTITDQRKDIECITIEEPEKNSCDTQNKIFLNPSESKSRSPRASVSETIDKKSNNVPSLPNYSFLPKPFSRYEHLLITKILDISVELKKMRESKGHPMLTDNHDRMPIGIDRHIPNNFSSEKYMPLFSSDSSDIRLGEYSVYSRSNSASDYEETQVRSNLSKESFPIENHDSRSVNSRSSVIVFGAEPQSGNNDNSLRSYNSMNSKSPRRSFKQIHSSSENNLSNKEVMVITID